MIKYNNWKMEGFTRKTNMNTEVMVFLCFILVVTAQNTTNFNKCGDNIPFPDKVTVTDQGIVCISPPCQIHRGSSLELNFSFFAQTYLEHIKPKMIATAAGLVIPWPLGNDACDYITSTICPLAQGEYIEYYQTMNIGVFPSVGVNLQLSIIDQDYDKTVTCFSLDIQIIA